MASLYRHLRARLLKAVQAHTQVYEASDGRIGAWIGPPALLLSVIGRKSGRTGTRVNPMWARYQTQTERTLPVVVLTPD